MSEKSVLDLNLSKRAKNSLMRAHIETVEKLLSLTDTDIKGIRGIGISTQEEISKEIKRLTENEEHSFDDKSQESVTQDENDLVMSSPLSLRARNQLVRAGITTISELKMMSQYDLNNVPNLGEITVKEIFRFLGEQRTENTSNLYKIIYPQLKDNHTFDLLFDNGILVDDIELDALPISKRLLNGLKRAGFRTIRQVAFSDIESLYNVPFLGEVSLAELLDYLRAHMICNEYRFGEKELAEEVFSYYEVKWEEELPEFDSSYFKIAFLEVLKTLLEGKHDQSTIEDVINDEIIIGKLFTDSKIIRVMSAYIMKTIKSEWSKYLVLQYSIPDDYLSYGTFSEAIQCLLNNKTIEIDNEQIRIALPTVTEWVETLPDRERTLLNKRLSGETLEVCASFYNLTRERVRQIIRKALRKRPILRDDDYRYWFENYILSYPEMNSIFGITKETYNYLNEAYDKGYKRGVMLLDDLKLTRGEYHLAQSYYDKDKIVINGVKVEPKTKAIVEVLLKYQFQERKVTSQEVYSEYIKIMEDNDLLSSCHVEEASFTNHLANYDFTLQSLGKQVRFYSLKDSNVSEFVERLHFEQYADVEISSLKLFRENPSLMDEYGILDEYELHNYLKKTRKEWESLAPSVVMKRMPTIAFGTPDKKQQAIDFMFRIAPVTAEQYCDLYEQEYGVLSQTVQSNMLSFLSAYYHNGQYTVEYPELTKEEISFLKSYLNDDFYFLDDVKKYFSEQYGESACDRINAWTLRKLHYKLFSSYLIKETYDSAYAFFRSLLTNQDLVDLSSFDSRFFYIGAMNVALDDLKKDCILLEYDRGKLLSFERLHAVKTDIEKEDLIDYVEKAIAYSDSTFFSIRYLKKTGFSHSINSIELSDWFFSALIKNSKKLRTLSVGGGYLFYKGSNQMTMIDFVAFEMESILAINIDDFIDYIEEKYGIRLRKEKILEDIKKTAMYYDSIMEKIYYNKDYYYDDLT